MTTTMCGASVLVAIPHIAGSAATASLRAHPRTDPVLPSGRDIRRAFDPGQNLFVANMPSIAILNRIRDNRALGSTARARAMDPGDSVQQKSREFVWLRTQRSPYNRAAAPATPAAVAERAPAVCLVFFRC